MFNNMLVNVARILYKHAIWAAYWCNCAHRACAKRQ